MAIVTPEIKVLATKSEAIYYFESGKKVLVELLDSNEEIYAAQIFSLEYKHKKSDLLIKNFESGKWYILK